jgi:hypothetical protein
MCKRLPRKLGYFQYTTEEFPLLEQGTPIRCDKKVLRLLANLDGCRDCQ